MQELAKRWDATLSGGRQRPNDSSLEALRERVLERSYINNLLSGIERELSGVKRMRPECYVRV